jgi:hypothetical protein
MLMMIYPFKNNVLDGNKILIRDLTNEDYYMIAKIIDNEFIGTEKTFTASKLLNRVRLSTNNCDFASFINIFHDNVKITSIKRLGEDTDSWKEICNETYQIIIEWYNKQSKK